MGVGGGVKKFLYFISVIRYRFRVIDFKPDNVIRVIDIPSSYHH